MQRDRSPLRSSVASPPAFRSPVHTQMQRDRSPLRSPVGSPPAFPSPVRTPSAVARQLQYTSQGSRGSQDFDLIGCIVLLGVKRSSGSGNSYFNMLFKTGMDEMCVIRVMYAEDHPLLELKGKPVKLCHLSIPREENTIFYNIKHRAVHTQLNYSLGFSTELDFTGLESINQQMSQVNVQGHLFWLSPNIEETATKKKFRNAVLTDGTTELRLTVWSVPIINDLAEEGWYELNDVNIKPYFGVKLETSPVTVAGRIRNKESVEKPDLQSYLKQERANQLGKISQAVNPTITSATAHVDYSCIYCKKPVSVIQNEQFVKCSNKDCNRRFFAEDCSPQIHGVIDVVVQSSDVTLKWDINNISDIINPTMTTDEMEMSLLMLRKKDFLLEYAIKNNTIVNISFLDAHMDDATISQHMDKDDLPGSNKEKAADKENAANKENAADKENASEDDFTG